MANSLPDSDSASADETPPPIGVGPTDELPPAVPSVPLPPLFPPLQQAVPPPFAPVAAHTPAPFPAAPVAPPPPSHDGGGKAKAFYARHPLVSIGAAVLLTIFLLKGCGDGIGGGGSQNASRHQEGGGRMPTKEEIVAAMQRDMAGPASGSNDAKSIEVIEVQVKDYLVEVATITKVVRGYPCHIRWRSTLHHSRQYTNPYNLVWEYDTPEAVAGWNEYGHLKIYNLNITGYLSERKESYTPYPGP